MAHVSVRLTAAEERHLKADADALGVTVGALAKDRVVAPYRTPGPVKAAQRTRQAATRPSASGGSGSATAPAVTRTEPAAGGQKTVRRGGAAAVKAEGPILRGPSVMTGQQQRDEWLRRMAKSK